MERSLIRRAGALAGALVGALVGALAGAELRNPEQEKTRGRSSQEEIGVEVSAGVETIWETERRAPGILLYFNTLSLSIIWMSRLTS